MLVAMPPVHAFGSSTPDKDGSVGFWLEHWGQHRQQGARWVLDHVNWDPRGWVQKVPSYPIGAEEYPMSVSLRWTRLVSGTLLPVIRQVLPVARCQLPFARCPSPVTLCPVLG